MDFGTILVSCLASFAVIGLACVTVLPLLIMGIRAVLRRFQGITLYRFDKFLSQISSPILILTWIVGSYWFYVYFTGNLVEEAFKIRKSNPKMVAEKFLTDQNRGAIFPLLIDPKVKDTPDGKKFSKWAVNEVKGRTVWMKDKKGGNPFQVTPDKVYVTRINEIKEIESTETSFKYRITGTCQPIKEPTGSNTRTSYDFKDTTWDFTVFLILSKRDDQWYLIKIQ